MHFLPAGVEGAFIVEPRRFEDARGFFARTWCGREFEARGLSAKLVQASVAFNHKAGTLRGMHYQQPPNAEVKLVRCTAGAIYDVIIDLRPQSSTYLRHIGVELSGANHLMLYIPEGFAHGYLTLSDNAEVAYQMSEYYEPGAGRGVRWNDPVFGIRWPAAVTTIIERDNTYPDYVPSRP